MLKKGERIIGESIGICEVLDIRTIEREGVPKDRLHYILRPCYDLDNQIVMPIDNDKIAMRKILSKEEAYALIERIPEIEEMQIEDDKARDNAYKKIIKSCECTAWVSMIKTLYLRKQERIAQGKKELAGEMKYLKSAEEKLNAELAIALDMPKEEIGKYIIERVSELEAK